MATSYKLSEASSVEKFTIINKHWAKSRDIIKLTGCSRTRSYEIIKEIQLQILTEGKKNVASGTVPMERLIKHLGISRQAIYKAALQEKELFGISSAANSC